MVAYARGVADEIPPEEDGSWRRPSSALLTMRQSELAAVGMVLAAAGFFAADSAVSLTAAIIVAAAVVVVGLLFEPVVRRRCRSWGYCERSADLLVRRGVLFRRLTVVPYGRMQLVDVTAGAIERLYGLETVHLHTAAAATDARIPGLEPSEARRLRDHLANLGEAQAAGI